MSRGTDACSRTLARHAPGVPRAQAAAATAAAKAEAAKATAAKAAAAKARVAKAGAAKASVAKAGAARAKAAKAKAVKAGVARAKAARATKAATEPLRRRRRLRGRRLAATTGAPEASRAPGICWRADREVYHVYDKRVFLGSAPSLGEAVSPKATAGLLVAGFGDLLFSPVFVV